MKVFISWSGKRSECIARVLDEFIADNFNVERFFSPVSIEKGEQWLGALNDALSECRFAIVVLTPENVEAHWILFEAGAIHGRFSDGARVCTALFGVETNDVPGALKQFQHTSYSKTASPDETMAQFKALFSSLNKSMGDRAFKEGALERLFEGAWPKMKKHIDSCLALPVQSPPGKVASPPDIALLQQKVTRASQSLNLAVTSEDAPVYFLDKDYNVTFANPAANLIIGISVALGEVLSMASLFESVKSRLENFEAVQERFKRLFLNNPRPPLFDFETIIYKHERYQRIELRKVALAVLGGEGGRTIRGWVVTFNIASMGNSDRYYEDLEIGIREGRRDGPGPIEND